ncbi:MAG TPA: hypothetical protein VM122_00925 [Usitatibacter sp.]|nr:hypothetical protein [Usitatibacter sp.]
MNMRFPSDRRATWRLRFLEIARQVEGSGSRPSATGAGGLRPRSRMGGFATLRRARRSPGLSSLA